MNCKICKAPSSVQFTRQVMGKYPVQYHLCNACSFMQTDTPFWLEEAYSAAITSLDIGLLDRNIWLRDELVRVIDACFPYANTFLDYAGGYGVFVRLMRDKGFNFYRQDPFCENIFAKNFDSADAGHSKFDVVTAFEVFEHFADPLPEIEKILALSNTLVFSTTLQPANAADLNTWWYIAEETGQHVAFYTEKSLESIAKRFNKNFYTNKNNLHIFTDLQLSSDQLRYAFDGPFVKTANFGITKTTVDFAKQRVSLLGSDFDAIKLKLNAGT